MMKDLEKRIRAVERRAYFAENEVCVLTPTEDGSWRMTVSGKDYYFSSQAEAEAAFRRMTKKT